MTKTPAPRRATFDMRWSNKRGVARWHKRQLSKARRKFGRLVCDVGERAYRHAGALVDIESACNWKAW